MSLIKKEIKQNSLIPQKIRKASFVNTEKGFTKKFKYNILLDCSRYISEKFIGVKRFVNSLIQKPLLLKGKIDFGLIIKDSSLWITEALIEGLIINFIVFVLLGFDFTILTVFAWGFAVKQSLSIYWRLKKDGSSPKIFKKN